MSEMEYYLTNLFSAEMFITNINGSSLSMKESEFQKSMQAARFANEVGDPYSVPELAKVDPPIMTRHGKEIHLGGMLFTLSICFTLCTLLVLYFNKIARRPCIVCGCGLLLFFLQIGCLMTLE